MALLNADALRDGAKRRRTVDVDISIGKVRLRALSLGAALDWQRRAGKVSEDEAGELVPELIANSWIGEDFEPLFEKADGVEVARSLDPEDAKALLTAALKLNGLSDEAVEEAEKNSEASRTESPSTGSPENSDTST